MALLAQLVPIVIYLVAVRFAVRRLQGVGREIMFAGLNVAGYYFFFVHGADNRYAHIFLIYGLLVLVQFATLRFFADKNGWLPWIAFSMPLLALIVIRYVPPVYFLSLIHI